jgi:GNAT superfamily N-acetyltransferase
MPPALRVAQESDADLLLQLMREYYAYDGHRFDRDRACAALLQFLRDPSLGRAWLIADGEDAVGYVVLTYGFSLEFHGRDAFIDEFYIRESHRGRGWGRQVLESVEQFAGSVGIRAIHLEVVKANHNALRVYGKLGFVDRDHYLMSKPVES